MRKTLKLYLELEKALESIHTVMDVLFHLLNKEDREWLHERDEGK